MSTVLSTLDTGIISTKNTIRDQIPLLIIGSLTLVLTLQWNNVITAIINEYIPIEENDSMRNRIVSTLILTIIIFILIAIVNGIASIFKNYI